MYRMDNDNRDENTCTYIEMNNSNSNNTSFSSSSSNPSNMLLPIRILEGNPGNTMILNKDKDKDKEEEENGGGREGGEGGEGGGRKGGGGEMNKPEKQDNNKDCNKPTIPDNDNPILDYNKPDKDAIVSVYLLGLCMVLTGVTDPSATSYITYYYILELGGNSLDNGYANALVGM